MWIIEADMERVLQALEEASRLVQLEEEIASSMLESPRALGWTGFTDWAVQAQIIAKTRPGKQWPVARALRKAALEGLQKAGIRVVVPRQLVDNAACQVAPDNPGDNDNEPGN
jgi:small-conductance mechanosensitive channel